MRLVYFTSDDDQEVSPQGAILLEETDYSLTFGPASAYLLTFVAADPQSDGGSHVMDIPSGVYFLFIISTSQSDAGSYAMDIPSGVYFLLFVIDTESEAGQHVVDLPSGVYFDFISAAPDQSETGSMNVALTGGSYA